MTVTTRTFFFTSYCGVVALIQSRSLHAWYDLSTSNASASHLIVVPLITVALLGRDRRTIFSSVSTARMPGLGVILVGCLLWLVSHRFDADGSTDVSLTLGLAATVIWVIGGFLLFYGREASKAALFPLLFLGCAVPLPTPVLDAVTLVLKTGSTEVVSVLFAAAGTPYHRDGFVFTLPNVVIQIADECSGIRSSVALLLTSVVAGHVFLRRPWTKLVLAVASVPLAILKNGFRIVVLSLLSVYVDPAYLTGQLHHEGGPVFFLLALAGLSVVLALLRRWDSPRIMPA